MWPHNQEKPYKNVVSYLELLTYPGSSQSLEAITCQATSKTKLNITDVSWPLGCYISANLTNILPIYPNRFIAFQYFLYSALEPIKTLAVKHTFLTMIIIQCNNYQMSAKIKLAYNRQKQYRLFSLYKKFIICSPQTMHLTTTPKFWLNQVLLVHLTLIPISNKFPWLWKNLSIPLFIIDWWGTLYYKEQIHFKMSQNYPLKFQYSLLL